MAVVAQQIGPSLVRLCTEITNDVHENLLTRKLLMLISSFETTSQGALRTLTSSWRPFRPLDFILRGAVLKKRMVFFRKTPKGGRKGLAQSKISLSEKILRFFWKKGGLTYSKGVLS